MINLIRFEYSGKHISAIFDQFGYSASDGQLVFDSLLQGLQAGGDSPNESTRGEGTKNEEDGIVLLV